MALHVCSYSDITQQMHKVPAVCVCVCVRACMRLHLCVRARARALRVFVCLFVIRFSFIITLT